jgi:hypothetical protein
VLCCDTGGIGRQFYFVFAHYRDPETQVDGGVAARQSLRTDRGDPQSHLQTMVRTRPRFS